MTKHSSETLSPIAIAVGLAALAVVVGWGLTQGKPERTLEGLPQVEEAPEAINLVSRTITLSDGTEAAFRIAEPFEATIAADGLGKARFMTMSPDGRLFVPDLVNMNLSREGKIYVLEDFNEETMRFEKKSTFLSDLRGPNSVAFYTDAEGVTWIYYTLTDRLVRHRYEAGDTAPRGTGEVIATFEDWQSPEADGIVWHITRTLLFVDDTLYVSVGSGCNACEQPESEMRAMILAMDPDGENIRVYAKGTKNMVGLEWARGALYATENGVDHLGVDDPDDTMYLIEEGKHYGWPYCYESRGEKLDETIQEWERKDIDCQTDVPRSFAAFGSHTAPLGLKYFDASAHSVLRNSFLVALHGSFREEIGHGYRIMRVLPDGIQEVFMDGFLDADGKRVARPVDILQHDEDSFFVTDDHGGQVFFVYAK
ncbi:MAG TPA: PQQ-dependent sugar dehydrogenase [Candidatus Paceibacterota bacterium]|nr:PQQ-dependent sugar dehydrogenase [Candidatus Paceibacterota bacterium]